jgi:predicted methyltransferase
MYAMLKPGGILGVEEHRLNESQDVALEEKSGYMKESSVIAYAEAAGFKLVGRSEINANPKDTKDYPKGVWTLPPRFAEGDVDRAKYAAIGESDRMTLKFVKPAK